MGSVISKLLEEEREDRLPSPIENFNMESVIKWKTGEPKESGAYLITTYNGKVFADYWRIFPNSSDWDYRDKFDVVAWCKLSDIEPYNKETK